MIACVEGKEALHIVFWVGRSGLVSAKIVAYCHEEFDAGAGTVQLPERALTETAWPSAAAPKRMLKPCEDCKKAAK